jgi:Tol biopolymer transport system component
MKSMYWVTFSTSVLLLSYILFLPPAAKSVSPNAIVQITGGFNANAPFNSMTGDGSLIAFNSAADLVGLNPDHTREIFLVNDDGTGLRQFTSSDDSSFASRLSADGSKMAFISRGDLVQGKNRDNSSELFVANVNGPGLTQLTRATNLDAEDPSTSGDGSLIVFDANGNYTGQNPDRGFELFVVNSDGSGLRQLTQERDARFASFSGRISRDGMRIAFVSTENLLGTNADHSMELFTIRPDGTGLRQLTFFADPTFIDFPISISDDGSKVVFDANANPLGTNADLLSEVFSINTDGTGLAQITNTVDGTDSFFPSIRGDGSEVVFFSPADLTGGNPNGAGQIFRANANGTGIVQLTSDPGVSFPFILEFSADGSRIGFGSETDLLGLNPDLNAETYLMARDGSGLTQLTNTTSYPPVRPIISGQANRVIFDSRADLVGANPGHSRQVFIADANGANLRQLTSNIVVDVTVVNAITTDADIAGDGEVVTFLSDADPLGTNPTHAIELFTIHADGSNVRQITIGRAIEPSISGDGAFIAFSSTADFVGTNADHNSEIFRVSATGLCQEGGPSSGCTQLTHSTGPGNRRPSISGDGSKVAFASRQNIAGGNVDGNFEVFVVNGDGTGLRQLTATFNTIRRARISADGTTVVFDGFVDPLGTNPDGSIEVFIIGSDGFGLRQLTDGAVLFNSLNPSITGDGKTIAFQSNLNPRGRNRDEIAEIFTINSRGTGIKQVTNSFAQSVQPSISGDGRRIGFLSSANLVGENPDLISEVFVVTVKGPRP